MEILWKILATLGLVALNGFFVAAEFAAVGARTSRLELDAERSLWARLGLKVKRKLDLYLSTCQLGITVASLGLGYVTETALVGLLEPLIESANLPYDSRVVGAGIGLSIATALHVVIGEVAPKNLAIYYPDKMLLALAAPLIAFTYITYPAIWLLNAASNALLRLVGVKIDHSSFGGLPHTAEELRSLLEQSVERGTIAKTSHQILKSAFGFEDLKVRQIMTPRTEVDYLILGQPVRDVLRTVQKSAYTRLPLCEQDIDHVIGLIHMKDLFNQLKLGAEPSRLKFEKSADSDRRAAPPAVHVIGSVDIDLKKIRRDILFVPEMLPIPKLLRQFQNSQTHMAVVVDEYGATRGIVTLEDVIEELVGEILDEFDSEAHPAFVIEGESFRVNGLYPMHELRTRLDLTGIDADDTDTTTLNGYLVRQLGRWPRPGDMVALGNYNVRVVSLTKKRVGQVLISPLTQNIARADGPGEP